MSENLNPVPTPRSSVTLGRLRRLLPVFLSFGAVVVLAVIGYFVVPAVLPKSTSVLVSAPDAEREKYILERAQSEGANAWEDHYSAALWFAYCSGVPTVSALPGELAHELGPFGEPQWVGNGTALQNKPAIQLWQVTQLSKSLYRQRLAGAGHVRAAYTSAQIIQWIIILLGLLTTIVVALSSTEYGKGELLRARLLRLFAITLPAIGTAVAAINAFYSPSQELVRATRTVSTLGQLHNQIALEVWTAGCDVQSTEPNAINNKTAQWIKRYQDIQSLAGTAAEAQPGGGGPTTAPRKDGG
jgi:hypothetical protein